MPQGEHINPAVLVWARESAGLALREAAHKLALSSTDDISSETKLIELERGARLPSRTQLSKIAKTYRRPLLTFYLATPPRKTDRGSDFRTTGAVVSERDNALLDAILRDIKARQEMLTSILEDEDDLERLPFVGSCSLSDDVESVALRIRTELQIPDSPQDRPFGPDELFRFLRAKTEALGVYVLLVGDLGSHHSALSEEVFRGFALADQRVPFIVINDQDARTARSFTLIHELVHIYLGESGISGTPDQAAGNTPTDKVEQFCNEVASYVLLPRSFETVRPPVLSQGDATAALRYIEQTAKRWSVSEPLIAFRLRRLGWITPSQHQRFSNDFVRRWRDQKASTKAKNQMKEGGPNYYVVKQHRLGDALVDVVRRTVRENRLTHTKAAKILGVKPASVEPLIRNFEKRSFAIGERG
jgi:Zn-dependent peptidase ImmA (M78 family)